MPSSGWQPGGAGFGIPAETVDGQDLDAVSAAAGRALARARNGGGPTLLEFTTDRFRGHYEGDQGGYRTAADVTRARERDPLRVTDRAIKAVGAAGGVLGMMFQSFIIKPGYDKAPLEALLRQFDYCVSLIGPEHVAVGPDYQYLDPRVSGGNNPTGRSPGPFTYPEGVEDPSGLMVLTEALLRRGFAERQVKLILGDNVMRLFGRARAAAKLGPQGDYTIVGEQGRHGIGTITGGLTPV